MDVRERCPRTYPAAAGCVFCGSLCHSSVVLRSAGGGDCARGARSDSPPTASYVEQRSKCIAKQYRFADAGAGIQPPDGHETLATNRDHGTPPPSPRLPTTPYSTGGGDVALFWWHLCYRRLLPLFVAVGCYRWLLRLVVPVGCRRWLLSLVVTVGCYCWLLPLIVTVGLLPLINYRWL